MILLLDAGLYAACMAATAALAGLICLGFRIFHVPYREEP